MAEYNIEFAEHLTTAAKVLAKYGMESVDAKRTVLYLSLLACEITLKHLLETAGVPIKDIRQRSHNLSELLKDIGGCKVKVSIGGSRKWVRATRIRSKVVDDRFGNATVGNLLEAEGADASMYPNQIRYGDWPRQYPPEVILKAAQKLIEWSKGDGASIKHD